VATGRRSSTVPGGGLALIAAVVLAVTMGLALADGIPTWEREVVSWFNDAPDWVAGALWPVMQIGTIVVGSALAAVVGIAGRDRVLGATMAVAVAACWLAVRVIKRLVDRDRPASYLPMIDVRTDTGSDLGFLSGHSAMAVVVALCAVPVLPTRLRWTAALAVLLVGVSRMVYGVHFPLDVLGGWAFGALIGLAALWAADRIDGVAPSQPAQKKIGPTSG
jgi:undecaprenyl-diphosphatase